MNKRQLVDGMRAAYGDVVSRQQVLEFCSKNAIAQPNWLLNEPSFRRGRGQYALPEIDANDNPVFASDGTDEDDTVATPETPELSPTFGLTMVPKGLSYYTKFGHHTDIKAAIASRQFFTMFVTGLSGCGKTTTILQCCHETNRECFRVNITCETDEDDLLGGFRLVNGNTVFEHGPVVQAMKRGAVLLLDEIDLASTKIMCLQPVLEGNGVYLKKVGEKVEPAPGFTIIVTANTKGQGSESGKFIGTNVMNEAFLDRFSITLDQDYPPANAETKLLVRLMQEKNCEEQDFAKHLVQWARNTREAYAQDSLDEVISTRRLVHIIVGYSIFKDRIKAIDYSISRFNTETKKAMLSLYAAIDPTINKDGDFIPASPELSVEIPDGDNPLK